MNYQEYKEKFRNSIENAFARQTMQGAINEIVTAIVGNRTYQITKEGNYLEGVALIVATQTIISALEYPTFQNHLIEKAYKLEYKPTIKGYKEFLVDFVDKVSKDNRSQYIMFTIEVNNKMLAELKK